MVDDLDAWARLSAPSRGIVPLGPGEAQPEYPHQLQPPEGFRYETDDEFRARLLNQT